MLQAAKVATDPLLHHNHCLELFLTQHLSLPGLLAQCLNLLFTLELKCLLLLLLTALDLLCINAQRRSGCHAWRALSFLLRHLLMVANLEVSKASLVDNFRTLTQR